MAAQPSTVSALIFAGWLNDPKVTYPFRLAGDGATDGRPGKGMKGTVIGPSRQTVSVNRASEPGASMVSGCST